MNYPHGILAVIILSSAYQLLDGKKVPQQGSSSGVLSWDKYYRAADISKFATALAKNNNHVTLMKLGKTYEKRRIQALVFSESSKRKEPANVKRNRRSRRMRQQDAVMQELVAIKQRIKEKNTRKGNTKPVIVIEAGAHAREWISPAVATYIAQQLAESDNIDVLKYATWVVVPLLNPDGYEYSHTTDRYWRKNRRPNKGNPSCPGVDINRNFKFEWSTTGSSTDSCSDVYHGKKAFSERETKAIRKLLKKFENIKLFLSVHSYGQVILHPWGYTNDEPPNADKLKTFANAFSNHMSSNGGRTYRVQQAGSGYQAGGGSSDYAYSRKIPYSYYLELPGKTNIGLEGFKIPAKKILGISQEVWNGLTCLVGDLVPEAKLSNCTYNRIGKLASVSSMSRRWFED